MYFGCAWYPEHWPEDRWATDLALMRDAGMNTVRVAEFAWYRMEPSEGVFDLDWLERAVDLAGSMGFRVVLGTPTAAPPAWLTHDHPDTLRVSGNNIRAAHGGRVHFSPASSRYRGFARRIADAMAQRFGQNPHVVGWQIDNEYSEHTYDPEARALWKTWLQKRYSLDELNRRWTTGYWSQHFTSWDHVPAPSGPAWPNPCVLSEYRRFMTDVFRGYQRVQLDAIRAHARPGQWITHNFHGTDNFDFPAIAQDLDRAAWDVYVGFTPLDPHTVGWISDLARGMSGTADRPAPHWVLECQPNHVLYGDVSVHLDPGEVRRMAWHFVAHGAEAVLFWQWRAALGSHEQYWGTVLAPDGTPRPVYAEIAKVGGELARVRDLLTDAPVLRPKVALLHAYPDRWALLGQRHHKDFDPRVLLSEWYAAARRLGLDVDVVDPRFRPVDRYALVLAPSLHLLEEPLARALAAYVAGGGHLVLGPRSGMKDEANALLPSRQPGAILSELLGASVGDFYPLREAHPVNGSCEGAAAKIWAEPLDLHAPDAATLLTFGEAPPDSHGQGWLPGKPAAVRRGVGGGSIAYVGAWLDPEAMLTLVEGFARGAGLETARLPAGLEVSRRPTRDGRELAILINHGKAPADVAAYAGRRDVLTDQALPARLPPNEVAVVLSR